MNLYYALSLYIVVSFSLRIQIKLNKTKKPANYVTGYYRSGKRAPDRDK